MDTAYAISNSRVQVEADSEHYLPQREHDPLLADFRSLFGRIGVFGGTFDPIHKGHLAAAEAVLRQHDLDYIVFIPAHQNPLKSDAPQASAADRLDMIRTALADYPHFFVSPLELARSGPSYTYQTIREVADALPATSELFLLIGADCLSALPSWEHVSEILEKTHIVPIGRGSLGVGEIRKLGALSSELAKHSLIEKFVPTPQEEISSTMVREQFRAGIIPAEAVPEEVLALILRCHTDCAKSKAEVPQRIHETSAQYRVRVEAHTLKRLWRDARVLLSDPMVKRALSQGMRFCAERYHVESGEVECFEEESRALAGA